jgi:ribosomal protein S18 acetylase RimI-like enzyme
MPRPAVTLRHATPADEPFLRELFADSRDDFASVPLSPTALADLVRMQYDARQAQYRLCCQAPRDEVIELDGRPVGRCWTDQPDDELRLLDLAVLRPHRRKGVGRFAVDAVCQRASAVGLAVRLTVWPANLAARRLYAGAGFREASLVHGYLAMERPTIREGA